MTFGSEKDDLINLCEPTIWENRALISRRPPMLLCMRPKAALLT